MTVPASVQLDRQKALDWLHKGAQPTDTVRRILSFKGVLYLKHLLRGVKLGLFDETAAMVKFQAWHSDHELNLKKKNDDHRKSKYAKRNQAPVRKVERKVEGEPEAGGPAEA